MNLKLTVSYDGTKFYGSQVQPNKRTIQGELEAVLLKVFKKTITTYSAGRTDTGVHAINQIINFNVETNIPLEGIFFKLKNFMFGDISINKVEVVEDDFHSRFSAKSRAYIYKLKLKEKFTVFDKNYYYPVDYIDVNRFNKIIFTLFGKNDFKFFSKRVVKNLNTVREIKDIKIKETDYGYELYIQADSFLRGMVRSIVASSLHAYSKNDMNYLKDKLIFPQDLNRKILIPPQGLYLYEIFY